jgi:hypothetical protein
VGIAWAIILHESAYQVDPFGLNVVAFLGRLCFFRVESLKP